MALVFRHGAEELARCALEIAEALRKQAIALKPLRGGLHFNLALALIPLGRYDEAETALRKAISLQPQAAGNYAWLAQIAVLRGQPAPPWNWPNRKLTPPGAFTR